MNVINISRLARFKTNINKYLTIKLKQISVRLNKIVILYPVIKKKPYHKYTSRVSRKLLVSVSV